VDNKLILFLISLGGGGVAYFTMMYLLYRVSMRSATAVERHANAVAEARAAEERVPFKTRAVGRLAQAGWYGTLTPILMASGFLYAVVVLAFIVVDLPSLFAAVIGLPASVGLVVLITGRIAARRRRLFQAQLMQALTMLAAQIEAGNGPQRALEQILPSLDDPLGAEMTAALNATVATKDLGEAMRPLALRYPSRAMTLFLAALEIDRLRGGSLAPTLRQAAEVLAKQFELAEETNSEISQAKSEFYTIIGIVSLMAFSLLTGSDANARDAYTSPAGLTVLIIALSNFAFGIWRGLRVFTKVGGERL
jgi:Flp pilus assembly protein TadB